MPPVEMPEAFLDSNRADSSSSGGKPPLEKRDLLQVQQMQARRGEHEPLAAQRPMLIYDSIQGIVSSNSVDRVPDEIWLMVFCYILPPSWRLDVETPLAPFPQSIWSMDLRAKLCIIGVCKTWHRIGLELLYRRVTLRRIGQMLPRVGLGALVRSLEISCFVPHGYFVLHDQETRRVLQLCPRLLHFAFKPPFVIPTAPNMIPVVSCNLTSLEYNSNVEYPLILPTLLRLCETLRSLSLSLPATYDSSHPTLRFKNLEDLRLQGSSMPPPKWLMPRLRRLWMQRNMAIDHIDRRLEAEAFLDVYGRTVKFLSLAYYVGYYSSDRDASLQGILDRCPSLVHLDIKLYDLRQHWKTPLKHGNIHSLDVFDWPEYDSFHVDLTRFPELRTLRFLDESLRLLPDLPRDLPQDNETQWGIGDGDDSPGSAWISAVTSTDPDLDDPGDKDYEFNVDTEGSGAANVSDTDSDSESDAGSCITVSEDGGYVLAAGEFYLEENREFSHDEALAIFRAS
ncbi:hypothetical protein DFH09DRAFT_1143212 [Mycena vulgaris]|nr:hypothetical protein DFH09DRAFT_1143212 [Mycena vulgaris]